MGNLATGIDIGSHAIKFAQLRRGAGGKITMVKAGRIPVAGLSPEEDTKLNAANVSELLRQVLASRRARAASATLSVTGRKVIVRYAHVPPVPVWRLKKLMQYEIEAEAGAEKTEEIASDFHLLDLPNKAKEFTVMIGMAKSEPVQFQMDALQGAGIKVDDITLTPMAVFNIFRQTMGEAISNDQTCAVANIGAGNMDMVIERNGALYFARNLTPGGRSFTEAIQQELRIPFENAERLKVQRGRIHTFDQGAVAPPGPAAPPAEQINLVDEGSDVPLLVLEGNPDEEETAMGYTDDRQKAEARTRGAAPEEDPVSVALEAAAHSILVALQSSLMYCKAQTRIADLKVDRMYLTGGAADLPGLAEYLSSRLKMPVERFDPLAGIDLTRLDAETRAEVERDRGCYAVAVGLALQQLDDSCARMSLLPQPVKARREFMEHDFYGYAATAAFVAAVGLIIASSLYFTTSIRGHVADQQEKKQQAERAVGQLESQQAANQQLAAEAAMLKGAFHSGRKYLTAMAIIKKTCPKEIRITSLQTFEGESPAGNYKTIEQTGPKYGMKKGEHKPPPEPIIVMSGAVTDDSLKPEDQRRLVAKWVDSFEQQAGLRKEKVFGKAVITRHVAEGGQPGFDIKIPLVKEAQAGVPAVGAASLGVK